MPIATPEVYADMLDRAKAGTFAYPAINITTSQTLNAALRGFAEAESDGIVQVSTGGAEFLSGTTVKDMVLGAQALAEFAHHAAKAFPIHVALHTDHCPKNKLDGLVRPLIAIRRSASPSGPPLFQSHMWDGTAVPLEENLQIADELLAAGEGATSSSSSRSVSSAARKTVSSARSTKSSTPRPRTRSAHRGRARPR